MYEVSGMLGADGFVSVEAEPCNSNISRVRDDVLSLSLSPVLKGGDDGRIGIALIRVCAVPRSAHAREGA